MKISNSSNSLSTTFVKSRSPTCERTAEIPTSIRRIPVSTKKSYQVLNVGEFLINPLNLNYDLKSLRIGLSDKNVVVSSGYIIVQNTTELSKEYYKWLLHIFDIVFMKTLGSGVRQTLSFTHIANSELVFPPLQEQTKIAQFLDNKTTKIDKAITVKEQQIQLLKERKKILIHRIKFILKSISTLQILFDIIQKPYHKSDYLLI